MRTSCAALAFLLSALLQGSVVAQELNDTAPEDINQPFVTTSFVSVDNTTTFDTVSVDNITLDFVPLVLFDSPSTTDTDTTNVTGTVMNDPVPTLQVLTSLTGPPMWTKPNWWSDQTGQDLICWNRVIHHCTCHIGGVEVSR